MKITRNFTHEFALQSYAKRSAAEMLRDDEVYAKEEKIEVLYQVEMVREEIIWSCRLIQEKHP